MKFPDYFVERTQAALIKRMAGASLGCLLWASAPHSAADTTWGFDFTGQALPPSGVDVVLDLDAPVGISGTFASPSVFPMAGFGDGFSGHAEQEYSSMDEFQTSHATPGLSTWSLSVGDSQYQFTPDFSGISADSIPLLSITEPAGDETSCQPTFEWTTSGTTDGIDVFIIDETDFSFVEGLGLSPTATSFTVPTLPAVRLHEFILTWSKRRR